MTYSSVVITSAGVDIEDPVSLGQLFGPHDLVLNTAAPFFHYGAKVAKAAIIAGANYADICDDWEATDEILKLDALARERRVSVVTGFGGAPGLDSMLAMYAMAQLDEVTEIVTGWSLSSSGSGGPQSLNPYLHLMKCCVGPLRMIHNGQMVEVDPLCRVEFDYPRVGKVKGWTIGSPEAMTLQFGRPTVQSNMNLMFADDATVTALQQLATMVRANALSITQAAEMVAAASAAPDNGGNRSRLPRLFGWAQGLNDGQTASVAAELRGFRDFSYDLAGKLLGQECFEYPKFDVEQGRQRTDVNDVLEQLPLPRIAEGVVAHFHHGDAEEVDVRALVIRRQLFGAVVDKVAPWTHALQVGLYALRVDGHHDVYALPSS
jgi:hypothetical protein